MTYSIKADRSTVVVGVSLLCLLTLVLYAIGSLWSMRQEYSGEIDSMTPRTARFLGFLQSEEQLSAEAREVEQVLGELAYSSARDSATTSATMQQNIREMMAATGLSISGSQILPAKKIEGFDLLNLNIVAEGNIGSLDEAIANLRVLRPLVLIESVNIKPLRVRAANRRGKEPLALEDQRKLTVRFRLLSLRSVH